MKKSEVKELIKLIIREATYKPKTSFKPFKRGQDPLVMAFIEYILARINSGKVRRYYFTEQHGPVELYVYFSLLKPSDLLTLMSILNHVNKDYSFVPMDELICLRIQFDKTKLKNMGIKL